jgi:hypothetical protein
MAKPYKINRAGGVEFLGVSVGRVVQRAKGVKGAKWTAYRVCGSPLFGLGGTRAAGKNTAAMELCKRFVLDCPADADALKAAEAARVAETERTRPRRPLGAGFGLTAAGRKIPPLADCPLNRMTEEDFKKSQAEARATVKRAFASGRVIVNPPVPALRQPRPGEKSCPGCGHPTADGGLCGECACEDDSE